MRWLTDSFEIAVSHACRLVQLQHSSFYYQAVPDPKEPALRRRVRELAATRIRFGYRRLTIMLRREGWLVNAKRVYRIYREEGLGLARKRKVKRRSQTRGKIEAPNEPNQLWAMDFVADRLENGGSIRILTLIDAFTREALLVWADHRMSGEKVAAQLDLLRGGRPLPAAIRVDNGSEFYSRAMDSWAYRNQVRLDFIRPGKPTENGYIESFNGKLRDECLNVHLFFSVADAQEKLDVWRNDYNHLRPHSALAQLPPAAFAKALRGSPTTDHLSRRS